MMTELICCKTIEAELKMAMEMTELEYPINWLEPNLHNTPHKLNSALQEIFDSLHCDRLIMVMGFCGNSVAGLRTGCFETVLPRVDDCISLLLGIKNRMAIEREKGTYFLSKGWLDGEHDIWSEYKHAAEKYGEKKGKAIFDLMFSNYKRIGVLDTGCYSIKDILPTTEKIAQTLALEHEVIPADVKYLSELLVGPWSKEKFLLIAPNTEIESACLITTAAG
jgi:hypothetical protein